MTVTIDQDTFTRADQSGWGTASGGSTWVANAGSYTHSIISNRGKITGSTGTYRTILGSQVYSQIDLKIRWVPSTSFDFAGLVFGWNNSSNYNYFTVASGNAQLNKVVGGAATLLASTSSVSITSGLAYWVHLNVNQNTVSVRIWLDGTSEPSSWLLQATDTVFSTPGGFGLHAFISSSTTRSILWDSFTCTSTPQTYYLSPTGSDSNTGTQSSPFATFAHAVNLATPGCVFNVLPGTFNEKPYLYISGTASNRIKFQSTTKWAAKIVVNSSQAQCVQIPGNYVDFWGFDCTGDSNNTGEGVNVTGSYNTVRYNYVHDLPFLNFSVSGAGISTGESFYNSTGNTIDSNFIARIGTVSVDTIQRIHGVYSQDISCLITNNIIVGCSGSMVALSHGSTNSSVLNNLGLNNVKGVIVRTDTPPTPQQTNTNALVANNIFYSTLPNFYAIDERDFVVNPRYINNVIYTPAGTPLITLVSGVVTGTITTNPQFVRYAADGSGDYRLQSTSPCIDAGFLVTGTPTVDYDGNPRPQDIVDIGPYEVVHYALFPATSRRSGDMPSVSRRHSA